ncbi:MAG: hypothetical protein HBSAPP04_14640 [Ignavibacteriaceae bacterium]|nr:MAG: hypothetical protein HBSAPP04_14640 [Ignavibacteriaceae bacterium]
MELHNDPWKPIRDMKDKIKNPTELNRVIAGGLDDAVQLNFRNQQAGLGGPAWEPLKKSTLRSRRRKNRRILQQRGAGGGLLGSITSRYTGEYAEIGTNLVYAPIHQFGGTIERAARSETFKRKRWTKDKFTKKGELIQKRKGQFRKGTTAGQGFTMKAHTITIPARPYLILTDRNHRNIVTEIAIYIGA